MVLTLTRRRALHVAGSLATAFAGCSGYESPASDESERETRVTDYELLTVRNPAGERFVRYESDDGDVDARPMEHLDSDAEAGRVSFSAPVDGVDAARRFLDDVDFERESLLLSERELPECRRLEVSYVTRAPNSFDVEFCSPLRPADVACEEGARDVVAAFVRLPFPGDSVTGYTVGGGSSGCAVPDRVPTAAGTEGDG